MACGVTLALADPVLVDTSVPASLSGGSRPETVLYYSGFDLWRSGGTAYGGLLWSPDGLNSDGFTLKVLLAGGDYLYRGGANDIRGTNLLAAVMPGWRVKRGDVELKVFAGLDLQRHMLAPDDPGNRLRGNHAGIRAGAELWWEPIPAVMMVSSSVTGSSIGNSFGVRGATGLRVLDRVWAGPEVEASGDEIYRQFRFGAHVTSFKLNDFECSFGAGYVEDNSHRSGLYGRFSLLTRR